MKQLTISDVIKRLKEVKSKHGNIKCISSIDDEWIGFVTVIFHATPMNMNKDCEFVSDTKGINSVCIN